MVHLVLKARPRVAPLGWPHYVSGDGRVVYHWVHVMPDGSGWTAIYGDSLVFPEGLLDDVLEKFYESAGPYPFDFELHVVSPPKKSREAITARLKRPKKKRRAT